MIKDEKDGAFGICGREERCIHNFGGGKL